MSRWRLVWIYATTEGVPRRAFWIGVVVGTLLNAINQGSALIGHGNIDWLKPDLRRPLFRRDLWRGVGANGGGTAAG